jgi:alpha-L-fucosidase
MPPAPVPTPQQLLWQDCELGMFYHFDISVYRPGWDFRSWRDLPSPALYNPAALDTDQWLEAARALGARYAVFVAKHCSGFCQWQTDLYPYGLRQAPWRRGAGDIVADFVASCRRFGVRPGLYASVTANAFLEVDNPGLVHRGAGGDPAAQQPYRHLCERMLEELWGRYGELFEIWFDGGALPVERGGPDLVPILHRHQPRALVFQGPAATIRWIGNEDGVAPSPCWATVPDVPDYNGPGDPDGTRWLPGECDVPVRDHEWFWTPDGEAKLYPDAALLEMYYRSVGRNCNLLLNANPGPDGLIPRADLQRYTELGRQIRRFDAPLAATAGDGDTVEVRLRQPAKVDHVVVMEQIADGERVRQYRLEGLVGPDRWRFLAEGASIGHKHIDRFAPVEVAAVRLRVLRATAPARIRRLAAYYLG